MVLKLDSSLHSQRKKRCSSSSPDLLRLIVIKIRSRCKAGQPKLVPTPLKHPPPAHLLRAAASCSPGVSVLAKAAGAAPTESVMPKAGAPMESVMPEAGAAIESVMPEAAPMESVLPDCWRMAMELVSNFLWEIA